MPEQMKIRDFHCDYSNSVGVSAEVTSGLDLDFPDAYKHAETMAKLALAIKEHDNEGFCLLPFCRTVEMEAVGGNVCARCSRRAACWRMPASTCVWR